MTLKKQADSSSDSSSGSSSDSSSGSSSSGSSGSASTSSDTDSSSESPKPRPDPPPQSAQPQPPRPPQPTPSASSTAPPPPPVVVSSASSVSSVSAAPTTEPLKDSGAKPDPPVASRLISSSEDDRRAASKPPAPPRRRSSAANKNRVSVVANSRHVPRNSGATARTNNSRPSEKPPPASAEPKKPNKKKSIFSPDNSTESETEKTPGKVAPKPAPPAPASNSKPKGRKPKTSVSPDEKPKTNSNPPNNKPVENDSRQRRNAAPKKTPPVRKKPEKANNTKYLSKETVSSATSTTSDSSGSGSSSDSDSSVASVKAPPPKRAPVVAAKLGRSNPPKVEPVKTEKNAPDAKDPTVPPCTDSDVENTKPADNSSNVTRKLTRSASARKSKHVVGKAANSDTDTETELGPTKRSVSKSPVKRATNSTKGPPPLLCPVKGRGGSLGPLPGLGTGAIPRGGQPTVPSSPRNSLPEKEQEPRCMLPGCDSLGHLSGRLDRHFTLEACPMYHNLTPEECVELSKNYKTRQEVRRRAQYELAARRTSQPSLDHRAYQLKVKDLRSKKPPSPPLSNSADGIKQEKVDGVSKNNWSSTQQQKEADPSEEREPVLTGVVSDYDLSLFREAQAIAAYKIEEELKNIPPSKGTRYVCMGKYRMEAWYQSPYPPDAARLPQLYLCEFCLNHHKTVTGITRHRAKCVWRHPPGDEVYRKGRIGVWQVDGRRHKQYCQQLCLLAKFFLDHKTLYYDVEPFLFYVMTLADSEGCHTVGYFSKEKNSLQNYNVSCILTLPPYQRQGYGRLLIDFSYLLTRVEGKIGSPEKPLSDLGLISYRSYWKDVLLQYLCNHPGSTLSIKDLSQEMAINSYDIVSTLQALGMMKYWKGKHIILRRQDVLDEYMERTKKRGYVKTIDPTCLKWTPFEPPSNQGGG